MEQLFTPDILTLISVFLSPYQAPHQQQELRVGGTDANASETVNEIIDTQLLRVCFSLGQKEEGCHRDTGHSLAAVPGRSGRGQRSSLSSLSPASPTLPGRDPASRRPHP